MLETGRTLTLAEKGGSTPTIITAHPNFRIVATMNPGGDYGKKELSPALSNRFTSVWVPAIQDEAELLSILCSRLSPGAPRELIAQRLLDFWRFFGERIAHAARQVLSVRDLLGWVSFVEATAPDIGPLLAYAHGAHLVLLDGIGLGVGLPEEVRTRVLPCMPDIPSPCLVDYVAESLELRAGLRVAESHVLPLSSRAAPVRSAWRCAAGGRPASRGKGPNITGSTNRGPLGCGPVLCLLSWQADSRRSYI